MNTETNTLSCVTAIKNIQGTRAKALGVLRPVCPAAMHGAVHPTQAMRSAPEIEPQPTEYGLMECLPAAAPAVLSHPSVALDNRLGQMGSLWLDNLAIECTKCNQMLHCKHSVRTALEMFLLS